MSSGGNSFSSLEEQSELHQWTFDEHKAFETALAAHFDKVDRWERIAACLRTKTPQQVHTFYLLLEDDVRRIDTGLVPVPGLAELASAPASQRQHSAQKPPSKAGPSPKKSKVSATNAGTDKRKGVPWTEEEHKLFLLGLAKFGKGDWRSIARNYVVSRTPTQVASHAQKYFIRLNSANKKDKRRASIHDITSATLPELQGVYDDKMDAA